MMSPSKKFSMRKIGVVDVFFVDRCSVNGGAMMNVCIAMLKFTTFAFFRRDSDECAEDV